MPDETLTPEAVAPPPQPQEPVDAQPPTEAAHDNSTTLSEYLESLLVTVILALFGTTFVVQAFQVLNK